MNHAPGNYKLLYQSAETRALVLFHGSFRIELSSYVYTKPLYKSMIQDIHTDEDFLTSLRSSPLVLVDFYALWCEPCKWLDKILMEMVADLPKEIRIVTVDIEKFHTLVAEWNVKSVPVLILFKNGQEVWRINGFLSKEELILKIQSFL